MEGSDLGEGKERAVFRDNILGCARKVCGVRNAGFGRRGRSEWLSEDMS